MGLQVLAGQEEALSKVCKLCNAELIKKSHLFKWLVLESMSTNFLSMFGFLFFQFAF